MTAQVSIVVQSVKHALIMPVDILGERNPDGRYKVKTLNADNSVSERNVTIGISDSTNVEIKSGLKVGDKVVVLTARKIGKNH